MICPACQSETLPYLFCQRCDVYLVNSSGGVRANLATRFAAFLIDLLLLFIGSLVVAGSVAITAANFGVLGLIGIKVFVLEMVGSVLLYLLISLHFLANGKTIGKRMLNLSVVEKRNGTSPGLGRMIVRETFGKWISGWFLSLGYFWAIWDHDGQAWHDKIAGTVVLRDNPAMLLRPQQYPFSMVPSAQTVEVIPANPIAARHYLIEEPRSTPWIAVVMAFGAALALSVWGLPKLARWYEERQRPATTETIAKAPRIHEPKARTRSTSELWKAMQTQAAIDWAKPTESVTETFQLGHRSYRWMSIQGVGPNIRIDLAIRNDGSVPEPFPLIWVTDRDDRGIEEISEERQTDLEPGVVRYWHGIWRLRANQYRLHVGGESTETTANFAFYVR